MKYEVPSSAKLPVASMFGRFTGQSRGAAPGSCELGTAVAFGVGVEASVGKGQSKAARVGAELGLAAKGAPGLEAEAVEEADGAAAGGRPASSSALSTMSVAKAKVAATRGRGQGRIGPDRSAFTLH